jgi:hypothetical protein
VVNKKLCDQFLAEQWDSMVWSYSRVSSYVHCPYTWYETYVLGNRKGNFYAYAGSSYHEVMEDFYNFWLEGGDLKLDVIKDTFRKKLVIKFDNNPFTDRWAQSTYTKLLDSIDSFEIYKDVTSVERLIEWEIDNYRFQGYIDLDAGEYHYDWKSRWDEKKYNHQQNLYLFAKEQVDSIKTKGFRIPQYKENLNVKKIRRSEKNISSAIKMVRVTIPRIKHSLETAIFDKNPNEKFFCRSLCGAKKCEHGYTK